VGDVLGGRVGQVNELADHGALIGVEVGSGFEDEVEVVAGSALRCITRGHPDGGPTLDGGVRGGLSLTRTELSLSAMTRPWISLDLPCPAWPKGPQHRGAHTL
jgi:hypothetical protein